MLTKFDSLNQLFKDELLKVADEYNISVGKNWKKDEIVDVIASSLTKVQIDAVISKYIGNDNDEPEPVVEEKLNSNYADLIRAMKEQKFNRTDLINELKIRRFKLPRANMSDNEIFDTFPEFASYLNTMLLGTATGKGLEFRTKRWIETTDKKVKDFLRSGDGEINLRRNVQGQSRSYNMDIFFKGVTKKLIGKETVVGFAECKHQKNPISDNIISIFQGQVEEILRVNKFVPIFAMVVTSSYFTDGAIKFAKNNKIRFDDYPLQIDLYTEDEPGRFTKVA